MKVRICFRKFGAVKFIGHLDIMRYFQKAMRRAEIPIKFSGGYSPHMVMSFANPLGVGLTSDGEYFDIELTEPLASKEALVKLNGTMVEGIEVLSFLELPEEEKTGMSIVAAADYLVTPADTEVCKEWNEKVHSFLDQPAILVMKESKKSTREVDIRPMIYRMEVRENGVYMLLAAGSAENLKPGLVMDAFTEHGKIPKEAQKFSYHRIDMYADRGAEQKRDLQRLDSIGKEIIV